MATGSTAYVGPSGTRRLRNAAAQETTGKPCAGNPHARFERGSCPFSGQSRGRVGSTNGPARRPNGAGSGGILVMWWVWPRRGPYEPEFRGLSRDRPGSRQNRDRIGPEPGDLAAAHGPCGGSYGGTVGSHRAGSGRLRPLSRCLLDLAFGPGSLAQGQPDLDMARRLADGESRATGRARSEG